MYIVRLTIYMNVVTYFSEVAVVEGIQVWGDVEGAAAAAAD